MSKILTTEQKKFIKRARKRVKLYHNKDDELPNLCVDCSIAFIAGLLEVIDALEFELNLYDK